MRELLQKREREKRGVDPLSLSEKRDQHRMMEEGSLLSSSSSSSAAAAAPLPRLLLLPLLRKEETRVHERTSDPQIQVQAVRSGENSYTRTTRIPLSACPFVADSLALDSDSGYSDRGGRRVREGMRVVTSLAGEREESVSLCVCVRLPSSLLLSLACTASLSPTLSFPRSLDLPCSPSSPFLPLLSFCLFCYLLAISSRAALILWSSRSGSAAAACARGQASRHRLLISSSLPRVLSFPCRRFV